MGEGCVCSHTTAKYKLFHTHIHMQYHKCTRSLESKTVIFFFIYFYFLQFLFCLWVDAGEGLTELMSCP